MTEGNNSLTTATLVSTERANHALVIGGICPTQASIPTGIFQVEMCNEMSLSEDDSEMVFKYVLNVDGFRKKA